MAAASLSVRAAPATEAALRFGEMPERQSAQQGGREFIATRFRTEAREMAACVERGGRHEIHEAETAVIGIDDAGSILHVEDDVIVPLAARLPKVEKAGLAGAIGPVNGETARHAKMHDEHVFAALLRAGLDMGEDIFRAAREMRDAAPGEPRGKLLRQGKAEIGAVLRHTGQDAAFHRRREAAAHGFDFG